MDERAQGGGETHECDRCGEVLPTEEELRRHVDERHGTSDDRTVPEGTGGSQTAGAAGMVQTE
jgi:uncharacterized C2H2 Zn-finger protein